MNEVYLVVLYNEKGGEKLASYPIEAHKAWKFENAAIMAVQQYDKEFLSVGYGKSTIYAEVFLKNELRITYVVSGKTVPKYEAIEDNSV